MPLTALQLLIPRSIEYSISVTPSLHIWVCTLFLFIKWISLRKLMNHKKAFKILLLVEALHYKPAGSGLDFLWCHWKYLLT